MSKTPRPSLLVLCAALAACADSGPTATAPEARPTFNVAHADGAASLTADGPADIALTSDAASAQMAASARAATGGRASGHVGFTFSPPLGGNLVSEQYSFVALATDPLTPFAAKGHYVMRLAVANGIEQRVEGEVICMSTVGNTTRVAGRIDKFLVNNVESPLGTRTHNFWTVTDNGEGQGSADFTSLMLFSTPANAQYHCTTGWTPPSFNNQEGNVQVQP